LRGGRVRGEGGERHPLKAVSRARAHTHTHTQTHTHKHTHTHTHTCEVEEEVLVKSDEGNVEGLPQIPVEPEAQDQKKKKLSALSHIAVAPAARYARRPLCLLELLCMHAL
jgi:hypothetical protein